ncbi:MAG: DegV family protein [Acidimicrobiales bacterium]
MSVGIVTDSSASLEAALAAELGIVVVPMQLTLGSRSYQEDELDMGDVVARLHEGVHTAGPSPGAFGKAIAAAQQGDGVLVLTVSERLSSTSKSASLAAQMAGGRVTVLDTGTAAGAQGLVVLAAAHLARDGVSLDAVEARARLVRGRVRLVATVDSLDQLVRGGRIPGLAGRAGRYLGVRPIFGLSDGRIRPLLPAISAARATDAILGHWRRSAVPGADLHVAALHALDPAAAETLLAGVRAEVPPVEAFVGNFGPVMVAHTGPGVRGLAWWWEDGGGGRRG